MMGFQPRPGSRLTADERAALAKPATAKRLEEIKAAAEGASIAKSAADKAIHGAAAERAAAEAAKAAADDAIADLANIRARIASLDEMEDQVKRRAEMVDRREKYMNRKGNG